jgi:pimeloyl-ACP methyl ester carboxylesterase
MFLQNFDDHRHTVATRAAEVSYVEVGAGPPALFVHGIATNAYVWHDLIGHLADVRRCIAIDLPLHGRSTARPEQEMTIGAFADVVAEVCQRLDLTDVDLVAHDTGGAIAQVFAARHPRLLRTLTLTNCETQDDIPPAAMAPTVELARAGQLAPAAASILADPAASRGFFATGYQNPDFLSQDLVNAFLEPVVGTPAAAERFQELIAGLGPADLRAAAPALRTLDVPTLIVWGTDDDFFDTKWAYWLRDTIPSAREVIEIAGGKLFFLHERAAELAPHIHRHWDNPAALA